MVLGTDLTGGGTGHGPNDIYPDGHEVTSVRLNAKTRKPMGRKIKFYQSGCFNGTVYPEDLNHLGKVIPAVKFTIKFKL